MSEQYLGLDLGTSSIKALVVDDEGQVKGTGSAEYPTSRPQPGWAEQDPDDWWRATIEAVQQAVGWSGSGGIACVGFSGQMHGVTFLGEHDRPLYPAVIWADQRSQRQAEAVTDKIGAERLIEIAGSPLVTGFMAATVGWMQEQKSSIWWRTKRILSPKDELRRRLTDVAATDPGDGSAALLLDARWRSWSPEILDAVETPSIVLPSIRPAAAVAGEVSTPSAEHLGLALGIPVATGSGDAACGLLGAGIVDAETLFLSLSTGAQVMAPSEAFQPDLTGRTHTFCSALEPGPESPGWYQMGATLVAGMAMQWLRDEVLRLPAAGAYEQMTSWASRSGPGANGLLFLPYLVGERTPHMDARARGAFLGLTPHHTSGDLVRAVMEGVTFACRDALAALEATGAAPRRIVMAGGGARSPLWRQMVADVFGLPVYGLATSDQAAMGAAILAKASVCSERPIEIAQRWARYDGGTEPSSSRTVMYEDIYEMFKEAYEPVVGVSHRLAAWSDARPRPAITPRPIRKQG